MAASLRRFLGSLTISKASRIYSLPKTSYARFCSLQQSKLEGGPAATQLFLNKIDSLREDIPNSVEIKFINGTKLRLPYIWLRDHCRCDKCFNKTTNQRTFNINQLNHSEVYPSKITLSDGNLEIIWNNDNHRSVFDANWLFNNSIKTRDPANTATTNTIMTNDNELESIMRNVPKPLLWYDNCLDLYSDAINIDYNDLGINQNGNSDKIDENINDAMLQLYENLFKYGFTLINNIEPWNDSDTTRSLLNSIAPIHNTFYGELFHFSSHAGLIETYGDLAYSDDYLSPHTDTLYFYPGAGLQSFQCYSRINVDFKNGESTLTDGFALLNDLRKDKPDIFNYFTKLKLKGCYLDKNELYYNEDQYVIGLNKENSNEIDYFRFNNEDRAIMSYLDYDETLEFYKNYQMLSDYVMDSKYTIEFNLQPGQLVLFNNWRVMHGRKAFVGTREMIGCYHGEQAWKSKYYNIKLKQKQQQSS